MKNKTLCFFLCLISTVEAYTQSNNLSSSPYSLYGLGLKNELSTGASNALGKTGIAHKSNEFINNLNPASLSSIPSNRFLFDVGVNFQKETLQENSNEEPRFNANFSNMAFAFPITKKSGFGITLIPFTNVGYDILGLETEIEGSNDIFTSTIFGSGGLNEIKASYGYALTDKLSLGLNASNLFGKIDENETDIFENTILNITEENFYNGFRIGGGFQYSVKDNITVGGIINLPTYLKGDQTKTTSLLYYEPIITEEDIDSFKLPLELGVGFQTIINKKLLLNLDLKRNFWDSTNQEDNIGTYVDQSIIGFGAEYTHNKNGHKYWQRIRFRSGFNFDNGNLAINDNRVNNTAFTIGLGLPFKKSSSSMINIGYTYGQKGQITNGLIQENYHQISVNLSLEGIWFLKRYLD
ncbi:MAG: hypothetical protein KUG68_04585 [Flavobacteriaceae bacterium]|nr:hypothetical protein [Flavobacteriaceae bacterium]